MKIKKRNWNSNYYKAIKNTFLIAWFNVDRPSTSLRLKSFLFDSKKGNLAYLGHSNILASFRTALQRAKNFSQIFVTFRHVARLLTPCGLITWYERTIRIHASNIREHTRTYEYIRVTYEYIRVTYRYIQVTFKK